MEANAKRLEALKAEYAQLRYRLNDRHAKLAPEAVWRRSMTWPRV